LADALYHDHGKETGPDPLAPREGPTPLECCKPEMALGAVRTARYHSVEGHDTKHAAQPRIGNSDATKPL